MDGDGGAARGLWVVLAPGGRDELTDDAGTATFTSLRPGVYDVVVDGPSVERATTRVSVTNEGRSVVIDVASAPDPTVATIAGRVSDALGDELFRVPVRLGERATRTDDAGRYRFEDVPPGRYALSVEPAPGVAGPWSTDRVEVAAGQALIIDVTLPGTAPPGADPIGSETCGVCHPGAYEAWSETAHARALRTPGELRDEGHPIVADFAATTAVDLAPDLGEARLYEVAGEWRVDVDDASGRLLGAWTVEDVYGGHDAGAALVGRRGAGERTLLPLSWGPDGPGPAQVSGFTAAWTDRWDDAGPVPGEASFDLACGGCHVTGGALVESGDGYAFAPVQASEVEPRVGCEACHGDGSRHLSSPTERALTIVNPARMEGTRRVELCARCHGRYEADAHPFADPPGWPATSEGRLAEPDGLSRVAAPDRQTFTVIEASRRFADQAGDLFASPHHAGEAGYLGTCADCHVAHGSEHPADLREDPYDARLCTTCHRDLDGQIAQRAHARHNRFAPGPWSPGGCVGCHMPRVAPVGRRDPLSMVGDLRAHTLVAWDPLDVVAGFDAAGADRLPPDRVPVVGCLDCHAQAKALIEAAGGQFLGPFGDPYRRSTNANISDVFAEFWERP